MQKDLVIIGAGPVGIYSAFYAGLRELNVTLIDALPYLGGQLETLYKEKYIYDLPGFEKITAGDFIVQLTNQMDTVKEKIDIQLQTSAQTIEAVETGFILETNQGKIETKAILIAAGNGVFKPRKIGVENEESDNLFYSIQSLDVFKDLHVAILGGGDSAVDWALMLEPIASKVSIVHRRTEFRAKENSVNKLKASTVNIMTPFVVDHLVKENQTIKSVVLSEVETEAKQSIQPDVVLVNYGFISSFGSLKEWPLEYVNEGIIVNTLGETSMQGVFAVGNAAHYPGKLKLITPGLGEVPLVIDAIKHCIDPSYKTRNIFSSIAKK